jgi:hypothetical protein
MLAEWAAEIGAGSELTTTDEAFQKTLVDIRDDQNVEGVVAELGNKIPWPKSSPALAYRDPIKVAVGQMMNITAAAMADPSRHYLIPAKEIIAMREKFERTIAYLEARADIDELDGHSRHQRDTYVLWMKKWLAIQVRLSDINVMHRPSKQNGPDYDRACGILAIVRPVARSLFGKAGDRVAKVFVYAVTRVDLSPGSRRGRFKR